MTLLSRSVFGLLAIVTACEIVFGVTNHSNLLQMALAGSLLAAISLFEKVLKFEDDGAALLFRVASQVVYVAMLFINISHCFEELTDFGNRETHLDTAELPIHHHNFISRSIFLLAIGDFFIKVIFCLLIPPMAIASAWKSFLVILSPAISIIAIYFYSQHNLNWFGDWINEHIQPLIAVTLTLISYSIVIPSILRLKPFLLADSPPLDQFDVSKLEKEVKKVVPSLENVSHVHASREWPEGFKVTMKAELRISKNDPRWVTKAAETFELCKSQFHTLIYSAGANNIVIEPVFIDPNERNDIRNDAICIDKSCHSKDVGCCTVQKDRPAKDVRNV